MIICTLNLKDLILTAFIGRAIVTTSERVCTMQTYARKQAITIVDGNLKPHSTGYIAEQAAYGNHPQHIPKNI
jgi:hypothetical protein